jgi:NADH:ubiquinone oxidoreductase subunit F (NADH-binding)
VVFVLVALVKVAFKLAALAIVVGIGRRSISPCATGSEAAVLADKDRIFTNVYGFQPLGLDAARKRGDWDDTKKLMAIGQDRDHRHRQGVGPARPRRRRLPDRHEVELHAQGAEAERPNFLVINADESEPGRARTARSSATIRTS